MHPIQQNDMNQEKDGDDKCDPHTIHGKLTDTPKDISLLQIIPFQPPKSFGMYVSYDVLRRDDTYDVNDSRFDAFKRWCFYTGTDQPKVWVPMDFKVIQEHISTTFFYHTSFAPMPFSVQEPSIMELNHMRKESDGDAYCYFSLLRRVCLDAQRQDLVYICDGCMEQYGDPFGRNGVPKYRSVFSYPPVYL
jgi:hypothetical protein